MKYPRRRAPLAVRIGGFICGHFVLPVMAFCQFTNLSTTWDGSRLYLISALRQHGTMQPLSPKIFVLFGDALSLMYQLPAANDLYSQYTVRTLQAAGDGTWVVYGTQRNCTGGSSCFLNEQRSAVLVSATGQTEALGANARLSRDGRWLLLHSSPGVMFSFFWRVDRRTGARTDLSAVARPASEPSVSLDGAVMIPAQGRLVLWRDGAVKTLAGAVDAAVMDDTASTVVYQEAGLARLRVMDVATGAVWPLGPDERDNFAPVLSGEGSHVLYLSRIGAKPQAFFSWRDGSEWRQLTDLESGVLEATLSGDGRVAWVLSGDGEILRIETQSGVSAKAIGPTPEITGPNDGAAGSAVIVRGSGLGWVRDAHIGGRSVEWRILTPGELLLQIPWDAPRGQTEFEVTGGDERLDVAVPFTVREYWPSTVVAIHEDFSVPVSDSSPVRRGEILHLYAMGLGPLGASGRTTLPWRWVWSSLADRPAEVLYAGVAPGLPGFYQVDVRAPLDVSSPLLMLAVQLMPPEGGWFQWGMGVWLVEP